MSKEGPLPIYGQPSGYEHPQQPPPSYDQSSSSNAVPQQQVIVTHVQPIVLGPQPSTVICPSCHAQVTTKMEIESGTRTHLLALTICLICFPLTCLPYCMDSCKSKNHYCPNCQAYLGRYEN